MSQTIVPDESDDGLHRDMALETAHRGGLWVHLTYLQERGVRIEQGWLHPHDGHLICCTSRTLTECREHRRRVAEHLHDGEIGPLTPVDIGVLIRVDATVTRSGHYVALWHHPAYADRHHAIPTHAETCCPGRHGRGEPT